MSEIMVAIIAIVGSLISGIIAYFLAIYKAKKDTEILIKQYDQDKKSYMNKVIFDAEFLTIKDLSEKILLMVNDVMRLFPDGIYSQYEDEEKEKERKNKLFDDALKSSFEARNSLYSNAPFISEESFNLIENMYNECAKQVIWYPELIMKVYGEEHSNSLKDVHKECRERTGEIREMQKELIDYLRNHINETIKF